MKSKCSRQDKVKAATRRENSLWLGGVEGSSHSRKCVFVHAKCNRLKRRSKHQTAQRRHDSNQRVLEDKPRWWNFTFDAFIFAH